MFIPNQIPSLEEQEHEDYAEISPLSNLLLQHHDDDDEDFPVVTESAVAEEEQNQDGGEGGGGRYKEQQHYLQSIDSSLVIRQLPSQGLSFQLWPAATTLVNLLDNHHHHHQQQSMNNNKTLISQILDYHRPLRILELGSGTGLAGIAAAAILGSSCTITDLPHVLPNLHFNATANSNVVASRGGSVNVAALRWGEKDDMECMGREFDILLGSDVVYYDHLYDPLLQTLGFFLGRDDNEEDGSKGVVFLMAHLRRWKKDSTFFKKARKMFDVEVIHTDPPAPGSRIGVVVYSFSGRKKKKKQNQNQKKGGGGGGGGQKRQIPELTISRQ